MIDQIGRDDIRELVEQAEGPCISVYIPTHEAGPETQQGPIRLRNLHKEAEQRLVARGMRAGEAADLLAPLNRLADDTAFWAHQGAGLAIFVAPGLEHRFRLDRSVADLVVVGRRFHVRPVLAAFLDRSRCYVLALSQNEVRLIAADPPTITNVSLEGMPTSLAEALEFEDPERQLQQHSGPSGSALFHGQGSGREDDKERITRFFRRIDPGLVERVRRRPAPVVLAAVDYLAPLFRQVTALTDVAADVIEGNPEEVPAPVLVDRAMALLAPHLDRVAKEDADRFLALAGTGQTGASPAEVVPAAAAGRVECLFVPAGGSDWGSFSAEEFRVELHPARGEGDEDLFDTAAVQTWLNGGRVHVVDAAAVPGDGPLAALYRY